MKKRETYEWAKKRVKAKSKFDFHVTIYSSAIILTTTINLIATPEYLWFKWPLIIWGMVVFFYALQLIIFKNVSIFKERMNQKEYSQ